MMNDKILLKFELLLNAKSSQNQGISEIINRKSPNLRENPRLKGNIR